MNVRLLLAPALLLLLVLPLAGCSSSTPSAAASIKGAIANAQAEETARFELTLDLGMGQLGQRFRVSAEGAIDFQRQRLSMGAQMDDFELELRVVDGVVYVSMGDGRWIATEIDEELEAFGSPLPTSNPLDFLEALAAEGISIERRGEDTIRGQRATHYRATVDIDALGDDLAMLSFLGIKEIPLDLWLDGDGRPVRLVMDMSFELPAFLAGDDAGAGKIDFKLALDLFDYGSPVDIEAPPASQVIGSA
jgi:hypothetical protein